MHDFPIRAFITRSLWLATPRTDLTLCLCSVCVCMCACVHAWSWGLCACMHGAWSWILSIPKTKGLAMGVICEGDGSPADVGAGMIEMVKNFTYLGSNL